MEPWLTEDRTQNNFKWFKFLEKKTAENTVHTLRRSLAARLNYTWYSKICILSNNAKLSTGRPLLPAYNFSTMASTYCTYRLRTVENMPPHFSAHGCYGQTAGWIRMPLRTVVRLGPSQFPHAKGHSSPPPLQLFGPMLWPASLQAHILPKTRIVD